MSDFYGPIEPKRRRFSVRHLLLVAVVAALIGAMGCALWAPETWVADIRGLRQPEPLSITPVNASGLPNPGGEWPVVAVAEAVGPSVVGIEAQVYYGGWRVEDKGGSGVILSADGYIVTNNHVVEGARKVTVALPDGRRAEAQVVGTDVLYDLAVVKIGALNLKPAKFGDSDALKVGELAVAIGNPVGPAFERTVTAGVISGLNRAVQLPQTDYILELVQTDAAINPGNSGGPLCNARGEVIGINTVKITVPNVEGLGLAIPSKTVLRVVNDLMKHGRVIRPWLGIYFLPAEEAGISNGLLIYKLVPGGPAIRAGLKAGDVVLAVSGREVQSLAELRSALDQHRPGDQIKVTVSRDGKTIEVAVTLGDAPAQ